MIKFFTTATLILFLQANLYSNLNSIELKIIQEVDKSINESIQFLEETVKINSGTFNQNGIKQCGLLYKQKLDQLGFTTVWHNLPKSLNRADHLFAYRKGEKGKKLLLIGHIDTVFEKDQVNQKVLYSNNKLFGPGTADMKGGNMVIIYALTALHNLSLLENTTITVALHSDEEAAGRPLSESRKHIIQSAKKSDVAIGFEGGSLNQAVTSRRGTSQWELSVTGREFHSSLIFSPIVGSGSILETSRVLYKFYEALKNEKYLTFNPGIIVGGSYINEKDFKAEVSGKDNIVAKQTLVKGDLRFISENQKQNAKKIMEKIASKSFPQTQSKITFSEGYPAMFPSTGNKNLLQKLNAINLSLNYGSIIENDPEKRGAADISFVAKYVDSLDGLGPNGGGAHTKNEYINLKNIDRYVKRAALLIYRLTNE